MDWKLKKIKDIVLSTNECRGIEGGNPSTSFLTSQPNFTI